MMYDCEQNVNNNLSDNDLCSLVKNGARDAEEILVCRYLRLVKACARPYFLAGADGEDLIQEGMFGLIKAIRDYDEVKGVPFEAFVRLCVTRRIYSALEAANALKHSPLNNAISLLRPLFDGNTVFSVDTAGPSSDPETLVISMEEQQELLKKLSGLLSAFEAKVLDLYLKGYSYEEMSVKLGKETKSVDNAIQRIRRKSAPIFLERIQK